MRSTLLSVSTSGQEHGSVAFCSSLLICTMERLNVRLPDKSIEKEEMDIVLIMVAVGEKSIAKLKH